MALSTKIEGSAKVALALLAGAALATTLDQAVHTDEGVANWVSYFTNLSNLLGAATFLIGGLALLRGGRPVPDRLRGAATLYLVITGAVYWTLLANTIDAQTIVWANDTVHGVMPVAVLADWLLRPPAQPLRWSKGLPWLVFPLVYLAYSLIRGPYAHWYPYDFLDPRLPGGYQHVAVWSVIITVAFTAVMSLLILLGGVRSRQRAAAPAG